MGIIVEEFKLEIFTRKDDVETVTAAITDAAHTGLPGNGIVAGVTIEKLFLILTQSEASPDEFWPQSSSR